MSYVTVNVDIDDIASNMDKYDRKQFFKIMQDDGYISDICVITDEGEVKAPDYIEKKHEDHRDNEFNQALQKLFDNGWRCTLEEEQYIINLSKRFI